MNYIFWRSWFPKSFYVPNTLLIRLTTNTPRPPCQHCGTDLAADRIRRVMWKLLEKEHKEVRSDEAYSLVLCNLLVTAIHLLIQIGLAAAREKERLKEEKQKEVSAQDRQVDTISTSVLFLPQFPLWQCTNTDSCTSSESASEIRLSWPSFIEYSGQPLDRSWTPGQPQLNPSNVNTEYDSASEQSDGSKHSTGEQSIPHTFKIDFKGLPLTKIQNESNCITSQEKDHNFNMFHIGPEVMEHDIGAMLREICLTLKWKCIPQAFRSNNRQPSLLCTARDKGGQVASWHLKRHKLKDTTDRSSSSLPANSKESASWRMRRLPKRLISITDPRKWLTNQRAIIIHSHHSNYTLLHWVLTRRGQALKAPFLRCSACADGLKRQVAFTIRRRSIACYLGDLYKEN